MKPIRTARLILRNWEERDRNLFFQINSDDRVMEFFPFRRDRGQADAVFDTLQQGIDARGYGLAAAEVAESGACIGFVGLCPVEFGSPFPDGSIEIGWRLAPEFWRNGYVTEAAQEWLRYGFGRLGLAEIVSFAVWDNHRSTAVMERIGMRRDPALDFKHPNVPDTHPALQPHVVYRLSADDWRKVRP